RPAAYPASWTAVIIACTGTSSGAVTVACSVAKLTAATTPGPILVSFFSTRAAHAVQVMPLIDNSTVRAAGSADAAGTSSIGPPRSGHRSSSRGPRRPGSDAPEPARDIRWSHRDEKAHPQTTSGYTIRVVIKGSNMTLMSHAAPGERPSHDPRQQLRQRRPEPRPLVRGVVHGLLPRAPVYHPGAGLPGRGPGPLADPGGPVHRDHRDLGDALHRHARV